MSASRIALGAVVLFAFGAVGCSALRLAGVEERQDEIVAEVDGEPVTLAELDAAIAPELYDIRAKALETLVERLVLEREAGRRGISLEDLVVEASHGAVPVTEAEVAEFFAANSERLPPEARLEDLTQEIRGLLEEVRAGEAVEALVAGADVKIHLAAPRVAVEAIGPALGPANAAVTIVEWSDYECPFCARSDLVLRELLALYPDDVRLVVRHLPLESHANARPAAISAACADEQGRFFDYHAELFAQVGALDSASFGRIADSLGLDRKAFDACVASDVAAARIGLDVRDAEAAGATGTPAFNVNGIQWSGARSLEAFVELVEEELSRSAAASRVR